MLVELLTGRQGKFRDLQKLRQLRHMAGFDMAEYEILKSIEVQGGIDWGSPNAVALSKEIPLADWEFNYIVDALKAMDRKGQLIDAYLPLFSKFIPVELDDLPTMSEEQAAKMREQRKGKKTVALVGLSPASCTLAPFKENVELWSVNEAHHWSWLTRATRWFQIHNTYKREVANRGVRGHYQWLKENKWGIPIYMIKAQSDIPHSTAYPIKEVCDKYLSRIIRGEEKIRYFNSSIDYMLALACLENFERIELYGIDASDSTEYAKQRPSIHFWIGVALGQGVEIWLPEGSALMKSSQYGGADQGPGWDE